MLNLNERYFNGMDSSIGDKEQLLNYLVGESVMELGFGSGELLLRAEQKGFYTVGVDASIESVVKGSNLGLTVFKGDHNDLPELFEDVKFDNIILCSVLHEIYSYTRNHALLTESPLDAHFEGLRNVQETISICYSLLNEGGRLLIRDGVKPEHNPMVELVLSDSYGVQFMENYLMESNNYNEDSEIVRVGEYTYSMDYTNAMEFMYTYTWGEQSFSREVKEQYGIFTRQGYALLLMSEGFGLTEFSEYVQTGYHTHLKDKMALYNLDGSEKEYPSTNMVVIATKKD